MALAKIYNAPYKSLYTFGLDYKRQIASFVYAYISPQINRAEKNKSYFYNCYGKEEKFYIENQG